MGYLSRFYHPDSFANVLMESACLEPENLIGDSHSSSINEQRPFKIVGLEQLQSVMAAKDYISKYSNDFVNSYYNIIYYNSSVNNINNNEL